MVMATNRQRFRVTFSHGISIWAMFWMGTAFCKGAEGTARQRRGGFYFNAVTSTLNLTRFEEIGMTHLFWGSWVPWVKPWVLLLVAVEPLPVGEHHVAQMKGHIRDVMRVRNDSFLLFSN